MVPIGSRATRSSKPLYAPQKRRQCAARTAQSMRRRQPQIPRRLPTCFHAFARPVWIARGDLAPLSSRVRKRAYIGSRDRWIDDRSCRTSTRRESWRPFPYRLSATGFDSAAIVVSARRGARRGARSRYPLRLLAATEWPSSRLCLYSSITSLLKLRASSLSRSGPFTWLVLVQRVPHQAAIGAGGLAGRSHPAFALSRQLRAILCIGVPLQ
jgi:hypothetical protein